MIISTTDKAGVAGRSRAVTVPCLMHHSSVSSPFGTKTYVRIRELFMRIPNMLSNLSIQPSVPPQMCVLNSVFFSKWKTNFLKYT